MNADSSYGGGDPPDRTWWSAPVLSLLAAVGVAVVLACVDAATGSPTTALAVKYAALAAVTLAPPAVLLLRDRARVDPWRLAVRTVLGVTFALAGVLLYWAWPQIMFPADLLIWSEGDFINDVLKFRAGYPLYTEQANNDSFTYPPGAQLLTYVLSSICGRPVSVPAYRMVQLGFTLAASFVALLCVRDIARRAAGAAYPRAARLWTALWLPACVLIATNRLTNPFTFLLHDDALALLWIMASYWCVLRYADSGRRGPLVALAVLAGAGFFVKQSLVLWTALPCIQIAFFDEKPSFRRAVLYAVGSGALAVAVVSGCVLVWGRPFVFWVVDVLGAHGVKFSRAVDHFDSVWAYYAAGLVGGAVLLRGREGRKLLGPWIIWLLLIVSETYTSGIAWMTNHIGPGSLIGGAWFLASLPRLVPVGRPDSAGRRSYATWLKAGAAAVLVYVLYVGMGLVRQPKPPIPDDAYRHVAAVEAEFDGLPARDILVDTGVWMHAREDQFVGDMGPSIGERGSSGTGDFSGILERLAKRRYARIIVRHLNDKGFWYDHYLFKKPSRIRAALNANYEVVRTIPATSPERWYLRGDNVPYQMGVTSILEPRAASTGEEMRRK